MIRHRFLKLRRENSGSAIIEFALVAPVFFLLIFGITEFGLYTYHKIIIESMAVEISRLTSLGKLNDTTCSGHINRESYIACVVKERAKFLINGDKTTVQMRVVSASTATVAPDICLDTNPPKLGPENCTIYEDTNGNGEYDPAPQNNAGAASDMVEVRISYPWQVQIPFMKKFFRGLDNAGNATSVDMISAVTVIRNEPFS